MNLVVLVLRNMRVIALIGFTITLTALVVYNVITHGI
jgi:hypothetical protein